MAEEKRFDFGDKYVILERKVNTFKDTAVYSATLDYVPQTMVLSFSLFNTYGALLNKTDVELLEFPVGVLFQSAQLDFANKKIIFGTMNGGTYELDITSLIDVISSNVSYDNTSSGLTATNVKVAIDELNTKIENLYTEITWANLKTLRDNSQLVPGTTYRIIDYICKTVQASTQAATNLFDILVTADAVNKLNETARACRHAGDTYFINSKLEAWKLKYCLDNDTTRFAWADSVNGRGVIYQMIDELANECPYDFKNIKSGGWYTFGGNTDASLSVLAVSYCSHNVIKEYLDANNNSIMTIGRNRFGGACRRNILEKGCSENTFGLYCRDNVIGLGGYKNIFGQSCSYNVLDGECYLNKFPNNSERNTFGIHCYSNNFSACYGVSQNVFGPECSNNNFGTASVFNNAIGPGFYQNTVTGSGTVFGENNIGPGCSNNTFSGTFSTNTVGNDMSSSTFGNNCSDNVIGNTAWHLTFGNYCSGNKLGNYLDYIKLMNYCSYNTFGNCCRYLQISDTSATAKNYISVDNGILGISSSSLLDLYDAAILNKTYQITFKQASSGRYLMLWATDTGVMTGKYKAAITDASWTAL